MSAIIKSIRAQVVKAVAEGEVTVYQANKIHSILSFKPHISSSLELVDLNHDLINCQTEGTLSADQIGQVFAIIPELQSL